MIGQSEKSVGPEKSGAISSMQFSVGRPDMVRAISQRWLLKFWKRGLKDQALPSWQTVEAENLSRVADNLSYLEVTGESDVKRFQVRQHGRGVAWQRFTARRIAAAGISTRSFRARGIQPA